MTHTRPKPNDRSRSDFGRALVFVALLFLSLCTQGYARELIADRAFVVDFSGTWTLEQAQRKPLTRFDGLLTGGYGSGTIWVRLKIEPVFSGSAANGPLFLRIRPMYLDDIRLFDEADGFKPRSPIGDRQPMSAQDEPAPFFLLKLRAGDTPRELWLRVESTSTRMVYFEVMDEAALRESKLKIQSLTSVYLTLIGLFLVIGFYQTVSHRDRLNASFSFYQIVAFINGMISFGYARWWADEWLSPSVLDRLFSINAVGFVLGLLFFSAAVLRELSHSRLRTFVFLSLSALPLGLIGMQFTGMIRQSLAINAAIGLIFPTLFFIDAIALARKKTDERSGIGLSKSAILTYFGLTMTFAYLAVLPILGWSPGVEFNLYGVHIYALASGVLMLGFLQYRAKLISRHRDTLLVETSQANERAEFERKQREDRQQMLNMLGHELKTPIATLKMLLGDRSIPKHLSERLGAPLNEMREVVERTVQSGQLEDGEIELRWQSCDLTSLIREQIASLSDYERVVLTIDKDTQENFMVYTDPYFLSVIVRNLLDNAVKYGPEGSRIQLALKSSQNREAFSITVCNEVGRAGRPDPEKIFVKYWRSPNATYRSGSGQGLYIVHRIATLLKGNLSLEPDSELVCLKLVVPAHRELSSDHQV